jgi:hypothetical protein
LITGFLTYFSHQNQTIAQPDLPKVNTCFLYGVLKYYVC